MTTQRTFNVAGWIAILGAVAMIPTVVVSVGVAFFPENALLQSINNVWSVVTAGLGMYVLMALRRLLHTYDFHAADLVISLLIGGLAIGVVLHLGGGLVLEPLIAGAVLFSFALLFGLLSAVLGYRVLPAAQVIAGPLKPFAYVTMISGVCLATIILLPIGLLASIAGDILLAMIFFRASEAPTAAQIGV